MALLFYACPNLPSVRFNFCVIRCTRFSGDAPPLRSATRVDACPASTAPRLHLPPDAHQRFPVPLPVQICAHSRLRQDRIHRVDKRARQGRHTRAIAPSRYCAPGIATRRNAPVHIRQRSRRRFVDVRRLRPLPKRLRSLAQPPPERAALHPARAGSRSGRRCARGHHARWPVVNRESGLASVPPGSGAHPDAPVLLLSQERPTHGYASSPQQPTSAHHRSA